MHSTRKTDYDLSKNPEVACYGIMQHPKDSLLNYVLEEPGRHDVCRMKWSERGRSRVLKCHKRSIL